METAEDLMTRNPVRKTSTATVAEAITALRELDARHLPVVNDRQELIGMVSDRDLRAFSMWEATPDQLSADLELPLSQIMSTDVLSLSSDTPLDEIIELMLEHRVGALPVIDADDVLIGIVSYIDVLRWVERHLVVDAGVEARP